MKISARHGNKSVINNGENINNSMKYGMASASVNNIIISIIIINNENNMWQPSALA